MPTENTYRNENKDNEWIVFPQPHISPNAIHKFTKFASRTWNTIGHIFPTAKLHLKFNFPVLGLNYLCMICRCFEEKKMS